MSAAAVTSIPCACSGLRYWAVPITEPVRVISEPPARAIPKSVTRTRPARSISTLSGFRSRCTIPCSWANSAAESTCRVTSTASSIDSPWLIRSRSEEPSTSSIEM